MLAGVLPRATLGFLSFRIIFLSLELTGLSARPSLCLLGLGAAVSILQLRLFYPGSDSLPAQPLSDVNDI